MNISKINNTTYVKNIQNNSENNNIESYFQNCNISIISTEDNFFINNDLDNSLFKDPDCKLLKYKNWAITENNKGFNENQIYSWITNENNLKELSIKQLKQLQTNLADNYQTPHFILAWSEQIKIDEKVQDIYQIDDNSGKFRKYDHMFCIIQLNIKQKELSFITY